MRIGRELPLCRRARARSCGTFAQMRKGASGRVGLPTRREAARPDFLQRLWGTTAPRGAPHRKRMRSTKTARSIFFECRLVWLAAGPAAFGNFLGWIPARPFNRRGQKLLHTGENHERFSMQVPGNRAGNCYPIAARLISERADVPGVRLTRRQFRQNATAAAGEDNPQLIKGEKHEILCER